jgi:hypothetical protein
VVVLCLLIVAGFPLAVALIYRRRDESQKDNGQSGHEEQ